ncbi:MAG: YIP1 family protein [bacterium]
MHPSIRHLLFRYWLHPREVVREGLDHSSRTREGILAVLYGLALMMNRASDNSWGEILTLPEILLRVVAYGIPLGLFVVTAVSGAMRLARKVVNGTGSFWENVTAVAFATVPATEALLMIHITMTIFLGRDAYAASGTKELSYLPLNPGIVVTTALLIIFVPIILLFIPWTIALTAKSIGVANRVDGWRGLGLAVTGLLGMMLVGLGIEGIKRLFGI